MFFDLSSDPHENWEILAVPMPDFRPETNRGCPRTGAAKGLRQLLKAAARKVLVGPLDERRIEEEVFASMAY
jgi:hypothetical protein